MGRRGAEKLLLAVMLMAQGGAAVSRVHLSGSDCEIAYEEGPADVQFRRCTYRDGDDTYNYHASWQLCAWPCCSLSPPANFTAAVLSACIELNQAQASNGPSTTMLLMIPSLVVLVAIIVLLLYICRGHFSASNQVVNVQAELDPLEVQALAMPLTEALAEPHWLSCKEERTAADEGVICSICLDERPLLLTLCRHPFHVRCLMSWLQRGDYCPLCKYEHLGLLELQCRLCQSNYVLLQRKVLAGDLKMPRPLHLGLACPECTPLHQRTTTQTSFSHMREVLPD